MKSLKLFALAVAVVGMITVEAQAGGRRSRGCQGGSCGTTVSTCSNGTCGTAVASTPATKSTPAPETKKAETTVTASTTQAATCGTCSSSNCSTGRSRSRRCR